MPIMEYYSDMPLSCRAPAAMAPQTVCCSPSCLTFSSQMHTWCC